MYIPDLPKVFNRRSIVSLDKSSFTLDVSGVAGFSGGAEAASAMATVHICRNRTHWGWYNSPGSYEIAKRYGLLTKFGFIFGGGHADPAELLTLFELDGRKGPQFLRVHSGNIIPKTDHLAAVFMTECTSSECPIAPPNGASPQCPITPSKGASPHCPITPLKGASPNSSTTPPEERQPVGVTIADLDKCPEDNTVLRPIPTQCDSKVLSAIPIIVSAGTCAMCAAVADWYSFSLILLGIVANGVSCLVIGSVKLNFSRPRLAGESGPEEPSKDRVSGILITPTNVVLLKGREDAAMAVAHDKFVFPSPRRGRRSFHIESIGLCSILLLVQFIAQLLLIPQGSLFGQIMFMISLGVSWCYNLWLCSFDKASIQQKILLKTILELGERSVKRYQLDNWPAMVVFVLLTLVLEDHEINPNDKTNPIEGKLTTVLNVLVEDTSEVWVVWKSVILNRLPTKLANESPVLQAVGLDTMAMDLKVSDEETVGLSGGDERKLKALLKEARSGIEIYKERKLSMIS